MRDLVFAGAAMHQVQDQTRINAARSGGHHQSLERREAHGGVDATPAFHRCKGSSCTEMGADQTQLRAVLVVPGPALGHLLCHMLVVDPVEAVAAQALLT